MADPKAPGNRDVTHRGSWFRTANRNLWHTEAHREYGVLWSQCGLRTLAVETESKEALEEGDEACRTCRSPVR